MSDKIKFSELVKSFAEANGLTQQKSEALIRGVFNLLLEDLENEGKASITNFGSFELKDVAERTGVNPQTGEEIVIPAHKKVSFKPFKALEGSVNAAYAHLEATLIEESSDTKEEPKSAPPKKEEEEKEDFEDPFESVIDTQEESDQEDAPTPEASEVEEEVFEEEEVAKVVPPVYKAPGSEKSNSGGMWLIIILLLIIVGVGGWFFFLRDSGDSGYEDQVAEQQPAKTEQNDPVQQEPEAPPVAEPEVAEAVQDEAMASTESEEASQKAEPAPEEVDESSSEMTTYTIKKDEWMWDISRAVYGEPYLWPLIFEANKNVNNDPNLVEPANTLNIPALEGTASQLSKSDYANLARASKMVSDAYSNAGNAERASEYLRFSKKYERQSKN